MTPRDLLAYLQVLDHAALRKLDAGDLWRLETLLHHWYVQVGDIRRHKAARDARPTQTFGYPPAPDFCLTPLPNLDGQDEHITHLGAS